MGGCALHTLLMTNGAPIPIYFHGFAYKKGVSRASQLLPNVASGRRTPYDYRHRVPNPD